MAVRKILLMGEDALRKKCRVVDNFDARLHTLLDDMAETMRHAEGAGLAAPQVGILRRVVVIEASDEENEAVLELINPEFLMQEGAQINPEGCLSIPGKRMTVERPEKVRVRALNRDGEEYEIEAEGFMATALCHELDHLDGILYVDKMIEDVTDQYQQEEEEQEQ